MRRRFVLAIALLSTCLTAGTCEFRAASNTPARPPPGENPSPTPTREGLVVVVNVGDPGGSSTTAAAAQVAMTTSVLSSGGFEPEAAPDAPSFDPRFGDVASVAQVAEEDSPSNPVPEPSALFLFGAAMMLVASRIFRDEDTGEPSF